MAIPNETSILSGNGEALSQAQTTKKKASRKSGAATWT